MGGGGGGRWGPPQALALPLDDRGLLLADGIFETVLVEQTQPRLLPDHLERWRVTAALLGMAPPPGVERVQALIREAVARSAIRTGALRLNWSRGGGAGWAEGDGPRPHGIDLPGEGEPQPLHRFWLQLTPLQPSFSDLTTIVSRTERRNAHSRLSRCKTLAYGPSIQARREARLAAADDALLLSTSGELCCATTANLLLRCHDRWLTPPLSSGCLPGVMRERALALGLAVEASLAPGRLDQAQALLLINSLGCRPVRAIDGRQIPIWPEPERLWRRLLGEAGPQGPS